MVLISKWSLQENMPRYILQVPCAKISAEDCEQDFPDRYFSPSELCPSPYGPKNADKALCLCKKQPAAFQTQGHSEHIQGHPRNAFNPQASKGAESHEGSPGLGLLSQEIKPGFASSIQVLSNSMGKTQSDAPPLQPYL